MEWSFMFFLNSILLGVGLAMDAFSVSLANGLNEPLMKKSRMGLIAGVFGGFQGLMPLIGWICVHTVVQYFSAFEKVIPWIALILLAFIGGKMLIEGIREKDGSPSWNRLTGRRVSSPKPSPSGITTPRFSCRPPQLTYRRHTTSPVSRHRQ